MVSREERNFVWGPLLPMLSVLDSSIFQIRCSSTPRPKPPLKLTFLSFTGSVAQVTTVSSSQTVLKLLEWALLNDTVGFED
ncbi:hypothetical protein D5086_007278 [Populus alba]|uniref:Uncharacterized protein n=1 Tax=Populus alba TaxID=43335 RepID=A0ACC4CMX8_POPAL